MTTPETIRTAIRTRFARIAAVLFAAAVLLGSGLALNNQSLFVRLDFHHPVVRAADSASLQTVTATEATLEAEARLHAISLGLAVD